MLRQNRYFLFDFLSVEDDSFGIWKEIEKNALLVLEKEKKIYLITIQILLS